MEEHSYREMTPGPTVYADPSIIMDVFSGGGHIPVVLDVIGSNPVSVKIMVSVESSDGGGGGATVVVVSS